MADHGAGALRLFAESQFGDVVWINLVGKYDNLPIDSQVWFLCCSTVVIVNLFCLIC